MVCMWTKKCYRGKKRNKTVEVVTPRKTQLHIFNAGVVQFYVAQQTWQQAMVPAGLSCMYKSGHIDTDGAFLLLTRLGLRLAD